MAKRERLRVALIGAGNRGRKYALALGSIASKAVLSDIVDPNELRCAKVAATHKGVAIHDSVESLLGSDRLPDAAIIATPERLHPGQAEMLLGRDIHILLEKPIASTPGEIARLATLAREASERGVVSGVCHVLRYHPYFRTLHRLATSGELGTLVSMTHRVDVGIDRATHTFVRGPWGQSGLTSPMLLSKCCHDTDLISWIVRRPLAASYSVGGRCFFRQENAPCKAARCVDCSVERTCPFSAVDLYRRRGEWTDNFDVPPGLTLGEVVEEELKQGRFGRCVFSCDNDVVDRQALLMEFEGGSIATLTMNLFTSEDRRQTHICLTGGEISGNGSTISVQPLRGAGRIYDFSHLSGAPLHAGADISVVDDFIEAILAGRDMECSVESALQGHMIACTGEVQVSGT